MGTWSGGPSSAHFHIEPPPWGDENTELPPWSCPLGALYTGIADPSSGGGGKKGVFFPAGRPKPTYPPHPHVALWSDQGWSVTPDHPWSDCPPLVFSCFFSCRNSVGPWWRMPTNNMANGEQLSIGRFIHETSQRRYLWGVLINKYWGCSFTSVYYLDFVYILFIKRASWSFASIHS